jgi:hypothetical protein
MVCFKKPLPVKPTAGDYRYASFLHPPFYFSAMRSISFVPVSMLNAAMPAQ